MHWLPGLDVPNIGMITKKGQQQGLWHVLLTTVQPVWDQGDKLWLLASAQVHAIASSLLLSPVLPRLCWDVLQSHICTTVRWGGLFGEWDTWRALKSLNLTHVGRQRCSSSPRHESVTWRYRKKKDKKTIVPISNHPSSFFTAHKNSTSCLEKQRPPLSSGDHQKESRWHSVFASY